MGVCNCSMFCCTLLYVHSSFAIILMGKRELVALLSLSSWCLVVFVWLFASMGLSAVCDCGISCSYSPTMFGLLIQCFSLFVFFLCLFCNAVRSALSSCHLAFTGNQCFAFSISPIFVSGSL